MDFLSRGYGKCQLFVHAQEQYKQKINILFFSSVVLNSLTQATCPDCFSNINFA